jgi:hypothetical protein
MHSHLHGGALEHTYKIDLLTGLRTANDAPDGFVPIGTDILQSQRTWPGAHLARQDEGAPCHMDCMRSIVRIARTPPLQIMVSRIGLA